MSEMGHPERQLSGGQSALIKDRLCRTESFGPASPGIGTTVDKCSYSPGGGCLYCMDASSQSPYARPMAEPFVLRERWVDVSLAEFDAFLRDYPRPLETRPPLHQKANYREWVDPASWNWPESTVAKCWTRGGCHRHQVGSNRALTGEGAVPLPKTEREGGARRATGLHKQPRSYASADTYAMSSAEDALIDAHRQP
jgi:hypothetical protein